MRRGVPVTVLAISPGSGAGLAGSVADLDVRYLSGGGASGGAVPLRAALADALALRG